MKKLQDKMADFLKADLVNTHLTFYSEAISQHTSWPMCNDVVRLQ